MNVPTVLPTLGPADDISPKILQSPLCEIEPKSQPLGTYHIH
jgi:hypothetical protein